MNKIAIWHLYLNMKKSLLFASLCILGFGLMSCKSKEKINTTETVEQAENPYQHDWVKLDRSGCFGTCPVYNVTIYGNGIVKYEGIRHVEKIGMFIGRMDPAVFSKIVDEMNAVNFMKMKDVYDTFFSDLPGSTIHLHMGTADKKVIENGEAPKELKAFQNYLDKISDSIEEWKPVMRK